jgi:hypothetical protein
MLFALESHTERDLIAAIAEGDHTSRTVYMDLLEQREDLERLEYLRLDDVLAEMPRFDPRYEAIHDRHAQLEWTYRDWCEQVGRDFVRRRLEANITVEDPMEDLSRLARLFYPRAEPPQKPWTLPVELQYLETIHAEANRRRR